MMRTLIVILTVLLAMGATPATSPSGEDAAYVAVITQRAEKNVAALKLDDPAKATRVRETIVAHYQFLHDLDAREKSNRSADKGASERAGNHAKFLEALSKDLSSDQVDAVKDELTYHKVQVTAKAYNEIYGPLTDAQQAKVMEWLKQAREEAIDGGSAEQKSAIFNRYKGKINNYLSKEGVDMKKREREWGQQHNARSATTRAAD